MSTEFGSLAVALADRYSIQRELGQGGMATVYLAADLRHERNVAIKVLRPELAASVGSERFLCEIRIAAQLQHPHVLPLLESGEANGFIYYVMPYVDGQSLRDRLARQGELPIHEAVKLIMEVVDALSYAHGKGVVHRDVKPDNVMLSGRHALVMDFGVAKAVSEASGRNQLTTVGVALGTPAYMAPEQATADPHLDHRVDIYAVGVLAYELLTGRTPFTGSSPQQILAAHVTETPDPVSKYRPGIAPTLEQAVMRCLAKRPADRWQTAEELMSKLEPLVTPSIGMTPTATRPIAGLNPPAGIRKRTLAATAVLGAAALGTTWILMANRVFPAARSARADTAHLHRRCVPPGYLGRRSTAGLCLQSMRQRSVHAERGGPGRRRSWLSSDSARSLRHLAAGLVSGQPLPDHARIVRRRALGCLSAVCAGW